MVGCGVAASRGPAVESSARRDWAAPTACKPTVPGSGTSGRTHNTSGVPRRAVSWLSAAINRVKWERGSYWTLIARTSSVPVVPSQVMSSVSFRSFEDRNRKIE